MPTCTSLKCYKAASFKMQHLEAGQRWMPRCLECAQRLNRLRPDVRIRQIEVVGDDRARRRRLGL